jgi:hydrogenase maturation factor
MCLTIPKKVISLKAGKYKLKNSGLLETAVSIIPAKKGDWVLTQNVVRHGSLQSVIIKKIRKKEAEEILKIINNRK